MCSQPWEQEEPSLPRPPTVTRALCPHQVGHELVEVVHGVVGLVVEGAIQGVGAAEHAVGLGAVAGHALVAVLRRGVLSAGQGGRRGWGPAAKSHSGSWLGGPTGGSPSQRLHNTPK